MAQNGVLIRGALGLLVLVVAVACADKNTSSGGGTEEQPVSDFLPYFHTSFDNSTSLTMVTRIRALDVATGESVDVDNPGTETIAELGRFQDSLAAFRSGTYDPIDYTISGYHTHTLLYIKNGALYKFKINQVSRPEPVRVSSESGAQEICSWWRGNDYAEPLNSRYVYRLPGTTGCDLGQWRMVGLSTSPTTAPQILQDVSYIVEAVHDRSTGALSGWLAVDTSGNLKHYNADFSSPATIRAGVTEVYFVSRDSLKLFWLIIDGAVYRYDTVGRALVSGTPIYSPSSGVLDDWVSDGLNFYFAENTYDGAGTPLSGRLVKVPMDGSATTELAAANNIIGLLRLTENTAVFADGVANAPGTVLKAAPKDGSAPATVLCTATTAPDVFGAVQAAGQNVYVEKGGSVFQMAENATACGTEISDARIEGVIYDHNLTIAENFSRAAYIAVAQYDDVAKTGQVSVYDATGQALPLGTLQFSANDQRIRDSIDYFRAYGRDTGLMSIAISGGVGAVYMYDLGAPDTLRQAGSSGGQYEHAIDI